MGRYSPGLHCFRSVVLVLDLGEELREHFLLPLLAFLEILADKTTADSAVIRAIYPAHSNHLGTDALGLRARAYRVHAALFEAFHLIPSGGFHLVHRESSTVDVIQAPPILCE